MNVTKTGLPDKCQEMKTALAIMVATEKTDLVIENAPIAMLNTQAYVVKLRVMELEKSEMKLKEASKEVERAAREFDHW